MAPTPNKKINLIRINIMKIILSTFFLDWKQTDGGKDWPFHPLYHPLKFPFFIKNLYQTGDLWLNWILFDQKKNSRKNLCGIRPEKRARDKNTGFVHTLPHSLSLYLSLPLSIYLSSCLCLLHHFMCPVCICWVVTTIMIIFNSPLTCATQQMQTGHKNWCRRQRQL